MRFLTVVFASAREFLAHYSDKYPNGALFCRTKANVKLREEVLVDLSFKPIRHPIRLQGQVISHNSNEGVWVHFDAKSRPTIEYVCEIANDPVNADRMGRSHSRYPARLQVSCHIDESGASQDKLDGEIVDLSRGGAFISGEEPPLVGTRVSLSIAPFGGSRDGDGHGPLRIDGRVAWVGSMSKQRGFGVRFDRRAEGAAPLRALLRHASEMGHLQF